MHISQFMPNLSLARRDLKEGERYLTQRRKRYDVDETRSLGCGFLSRWTMLFSSIVL